MLQETQTLRTNPTQYTAQIEQAAIQDIEIPTDIPPISIEQPMTSIQMTLTGVAPLKQQNGGFLYGNAPLQFTGQ